MSVHWRGLIQGPGDFAVRRYRQLLDSGKENKNEICRQCAVYYRVPVHLLRQELKLYWFKRGDKVWYDGEVWEVFGPCPGVHTEGQVYRLLSPDQSKECDALEQDMDWFDAEASLLLGKAS